MSPATKAALYKIAGARTTRTGVSRARKRHIWIDAYGESHRGKPKAEVKGGFEGKAGSIRRSRKGATRRLSNGRRYYVDNLAETAIAYTTWR